ncbi:mannose-1-phosphate guanylyltransferase [Anditalea andensis]|uniref:Mannose-1-phosphate guanylyltransferase n=1 Tax=Anditalea andensis TaxID=1048983 RepID=A0A074KSE5_9BACT|nr:sugar phosphate nucleotidyltransferase [Anditalea andensis]KEO71839.1 mannose-1-phosphate guanylyltransferase [Anditalea andensis]
MIKHVLLSGGVGSRLWPLSRQSSPKQYLEVFGGQSLFELAVSRNAPFTDNLIVVGNTDNQQLSLSILEKLEVKAFTNIVEATPRNTAPAIAFAAFAADPDDILLVTPADHIIREGAAYEAAIKRAIELAAEGAIVTFGIKPTRPETGYGYIQHEAEKVIAFREKPDLKTAKQFLLSEGFLWNSGMFCFQAKVFLEELQKFEPKVYLAASHAWERAIDGNLALDLSMEIPSISVDFAVMERSDKIKVVGAEFDWSDMGSFEAVYDYLKASGYPVDENGNMQIGSTKHISFVGVKDCILVTTDDAFLVVSKSASQKVKGLYESLQKNNVSLVR